MKKPTSASDVQKLIDADPQLRAQAMRSALEASLSGQLRCMYCGSSHCLYSTPKMEADFSWTVNIKCLSCGEVFHIRTGELTVNKLVSVKESKKMVPFGQTRIGRPPDA
jgi:ribosomal protein S27E